MSSTLVALTGYALWTLLLTLAIGLTRVYFVQTGRKKANDFAPGAEDLGGFSRRLARAHANCYENLPVFAAVALSAYVSGHASMSDPLAMWVLYARVAQSVVHMASTSVPAVYLRFALFVAQVVLIVTIAVEVVFGI